MSNIEFRVAKHLSAEYWQQTILRFLTLRLPIDLPYDIRKFRIECDDIHIVGVSNGLVVAALVLTRGDSEFVRLRSVGVNPELQGTGIGMKLMKFSEDCAMGAGYRTVVLHARENVVGFYKKTGYTIEGELFLEVGLPHLKMVKNLFGSARA